MGRAPVSSITPIIATYGHRECGKETASLDRSGIEHNTTRLKPNNLGAQTTNATKLELSQVKYK
ncbi:hypothetical protein GBA52_021976 [Prunus armeniaca]|nr:hypothetical protein GBA52_021976 [Prunus armeniaca]